MRTQTSRSPSKESTSAASGSAPSQRREAAQLPSCSQLILGADKRNPLFTVYQDRQRNQILVFYGLELMEALPDAEDCPAFKLMVARLYNARVSVTTLCRTFQVDRKTIQKWARALKSGDAKELIRVLEGPSARRKLTPEVEAFVRHRWPEILAERAYGALSRLRKELRLFLRVTLSDVTLRPLIRTLKSEVAASHSACGSTGPCGQEEKPMPLAAWPAAEGSEQKREIAFDCSSSQSGSLNPLNFNDNKEIGASAPGVDSPANNRKLIPAISNSLPEGSHYCEHAGVLLFAQVLKQVSSLFPACGGILSQWLSSLWLGALNIEQTKFLNCEVLEMILGSVVRYPTPQRDLLKTLATDDTIHRLLRYNVEQSEALGCSDFYFDPHSKQYTGEQNVLKGWCSKIRWADKVLLSDFLHSRRGEPVYFETTDNFDDMRTRFFSFIARARSVLNWPSDRVISVVVDRGIFDGKVFEKVIEDPLLHLITWQKGFEPQSWDPAKVSGTTVLTRARNNSKDLRNYHFEYVDQDWTTNPRMRQLIVQATDPKGRIIQVAILTDDRKRAASEIILLMFQRWLQENDFKYLDKHFGINQITAYSAIPYEELRDQLQDREVKSAERKALEASRAGVQRQQAKLLLTQEKSDFANRKHQQQKSQLEVQLSQLDAKANEERTRITTQIRRLQSSCQRHEKMSLKRRQRIDDLNLKLDAFESGLATGDGRVSRLEELIAADKVRMEPQSKRLLDTLRILARNQFYKSLASFKEAYDNYRDDHDYFRQLTRSPGVLEVGKESLLIHLFPQSPYGATMRKHVSRVLEILNAKQMSHPTRSELSLKFRLALRSEMTVSVKVDP